MYFYIALYVYMQNIYALKFLKYGQTFVISINFVHFRK